MKNFKKKVVTTYYWKDIEIKFKPEGTDFDHIAWIDESSGRLDFSIYNDFRGNKRGANVFEEDCVRFAEAICKLPCKATSIGYGEISTISIIPTKKIF